MNRNELLNKIILDLEFENSEDIPLDIFPNEIQKIAYEVAKFENYNIEFVVVGILSSAAAAIGNSCMIRVKSEWISSPSLYFNLVGIKGIGKTHPINYFYNPIIQIDKKTLREFKKNNKNLNENDCANYKINVVNDMTYEALINAHHINQHGIAVVVDELTGLFNMANRYTNKSNMVETLLSSYSGQPITLIRRGDRYPTIINRPCFNIVGSVQVELVSEMFHKTFRSNGLMDRFIFVYPQKQKLSRYQKDSNKVKHNSSIIWDSIINKLLNIKNQLDDDGNIIPHIINMSDEASSYFIDYCNDIIDAYNDINDKRHVDTRILKTNDKVARFALVIQLMRWASLEAKMDEIDLTSIKSAIRLVNYFEEQYYKVIDEFFDPNPKNRCEIFYDELPENFNAKEAISIAQALGICERSVFDYLDKLCKTTPPKLYKKGHRRSAIYNKKAD